jgi:hypothetical protein
MEKDRKIYRATTNGSVEILLSNHLSRCGKVVEVDPTLIAIQARLQDHKKMPTRATGENFSLKGCQIRGLIRILERTLIRRSIWMLDFLAS